MSGEPGGRSEAPDDRAGAPGCADVAAASCVDASSEDGADGFAEDDRRSPLRRCLVTHAVGPKAGLVRFALSPDGASVVPDVDERLPGRGLWVTAERDIVQRAVQRRLFQRAARAPVATGDDLADRVAALLRARCLDWLGLARRAGRAVAGFEKVRAALGKGDVALLVEAEDAGRHGGERLSRLSGGLPVIRQFDAETLGRVFGRSHAVHVAVARGRLADRFARDAARLAGFETTAARVRPEDERAAAQQA